MATDIILYCQYVASKIGKTGLLDVTVDVQQILRSTGAWSSVASAQAATEGIHGIYSYRVAGATLQTHDYAAIFHTADATVDQQHLPALIVPYAYAYSAELAYLDASVAGVPDTVWNEALAGHLGVGSVGAKLNSLCCTLGGGSVVYPYTVTDGDTGALLANVIVTVTSDVAGTTVVAQGTTSALGVVSFWLDPGTYYFWLARAGYQFANPDTEVVV